MPKPLPTERLAGPPKCPPALEASETRFRKLIENTADGILVVRPDGIIRYVNPAATVLLNRPADALVGRFFGIPIIAGDTTEIDLPYADGEVGVAEMRVVDTEWEGEPALLASLRDISDRKRLEDELRQKVSELALADQRKDEFLAMLAHELRNPLAPILNAVHIMRLRGDDRVLREKMRDVVEQQVRCMARLVDDLLDVSRITRGKIQLRFEPVSLSSLIHRSIETVRPHLSAKQQELRVTLPDEPARLWADPVRLEQVLNNLLNNAVKYTDKRGVIELVAERRGDEVEIRIKDNGIGIAPEMQEAIFGLFTQVDQSLARSQGGLGIGLTLARNLVHMHQGRLTARSAGLGRGSEFIVTLPVSKEALDLVPESPAVATRTVGNVRRVLVVDDNLASADSLGLIIRLWGHECRVTHSGPEAIDEADVFRPDVVLLDIGLPGLDGYEVARELRRRPHLGDLVLIAMTGYGREEDRRRAREAGFNEHLVKPLDLDALELLLAQPDPSEGEEASAP
jgi:signal transduction histidine kinase/ActR/RegA family two-component response regulator